MLRGSEKSLKFTIVASLLFLIAIIQVLPQVDLPDTVFHEDEAPAVAKFRLVPALLTMVLFAIAAVILRQAAARSADGLTLDPENRPVAKPQILTVSLLC